MGSEKGMRIAKVAILGKSVLMLRKVTLDRYLSSSCLGLFEDREAKMLIIILFEM